MSLSFRQLSEKDGVSVAPSILSADFSRLDTEVKAVEEAGADLLHLDVMDGHFVPPITFGPMVVEAIAKLTRLPLISHLMINDPARHVEEFVKAGSSVVSFHWEACESRHEQIIEKIQGLDCGAGIALNPDTPLAAVEHLLGIIDLIVIMTVYPGYGGQTFIPEVVEKIERTARIKKEQSHNYLIEVDGGIKPENAATVREAGAQILVAGSAVFGSDDYKRVISSIRGRDRG